MTTGDCQCQVLDPAAENAYFLSCTRCCDFGCERAAVLKVSGKFISHRNSFSDRHNFVKESTVYLDYIRDRHAICRKRQGTKEDLPINELSRAALRVFRFGQKVE
jgi:hypothetical protein